MNFGGKIKKYIVGRVVIWKAVFFVFVCFYFFAAEGAVAWYIALSLEIPTVDGRRLMISDDNLFEF